MRFQRALDFITLALAPEALSAQSAFQGIIQPGTHLPHLSLAIVDQCLAKGY